MIIPEKTSKIPLPSLNRLCKINIILDEYQQKGETTLSSQEIGKRFRKGYHNNRKYMGYLSESGRSGSGYEVKKFQRRINEIFGFNRKRHACIIGLDCFGSILIGGHSPQFPCFSIIAGFDSHTSILETVRTSIPVYPTCEIRSVLKMNISNLTSSSSRTVTWKRSWTD